MAGFFRNIVNRIIGGEDETGMPNYDRIPEYRRNHAFIVMNPMANDSSIKYLSVPMPYGYSFFDTVGQSIADAMPRDFFGGGKNPTSVASNLAVSALNAFNPLGGGATIIQTITPTIATPFADIATNKDYAGRPIRPEPSPYDPVKPPASQLYWNNVNPISKWIADKLNSLTGGSKFRSGAIDISPETLDYAYEFATGAVGKFVERVLMAPSHIAKTLNKDYNIEDFIGEVPMGRKVIGAIPSFVDVKRYQDMRTEVMTVDKELKDAIQLGDRERAMDVRQEAGKELSMVGMIKHTEQRLKELRTQKRKLEDRMNQTTQDDVKSRIDDQIRANKDLQNKIMINALKRYNSLIDERK